MSNQAQNQNAKKYDLEERTAVYGEKVIEFAKKIPKNEITRPLISQVVRSSSGIGANYLEADCVDSKKDFKYKITLCKKESRETTHWLRMIAKANEKLKSECRTLWKEAHELTLIPKQKKNSLSLMH